MAGWTEAGLPCCKLYSMKTIKCMNTNFENVKTSNQWALAQIFVLVAVCTMVQFSYSFMNPFLQAHFSLGKQQLGLLAAATSGGCLAFSFASGILVDRVSFMKAMVVGAGLIGGAAALFIYAPVYSIILLLFFIIGAGYSVILPLTNKGAVNLFPEGRQAFAIGLKQSGAPLGTALGSALLPSLAVYAGWGVTYLVMFALVLAVVLLVAALYRTPWSVKGRCPAASHAPAEKSAGLTDGRGHSGGGAGRLVLYSNVLMGMAFSMTQVIMLAFLVPLYREQVGLSVLGAAALLGISQLSGALARPGVGWLAEYRPGKKRQVLGMLGICNAAVLVAFGFLSAGTGWPVLVVLSFLVGAVAMGWYGPVYSLMIEIMGQDQAGKASGLVTTFNLLAMTVASPLFGYLNEGLQCYNLPLWIFALFMLGATLLFVFAGSRAFTPRPAR